MPSDFPELSRNLSDRHLQLIGRVATEWAWLDYNIHRGIASLLLLEEHQAMASSVFISTAHRLQLLIGLLEDSRADKDTLAEFRNLSNEIRRVEGLRNEIVHAVWYDTTGSDGEYQVSGTFHKRGKYRPSTIHKSDSEIEDVVIDLVAVSNELEEFLNAHTAGPP